MGRSACRELVEALVVPVKLRPGAGGPDGLNPASATCKQKAPFNNECISDAEPVTGYAPMLLAHASPGGPRCPMERCLRLHDVRSNTFGAFTRNYVCAAGAERIFYAAEVAPSV